MPTPNEIGVRLGAIGEFAIGQGSPVNAESFDIECAIVATETADAARLFLFEIECAIAATEAKDIATFGNRDNLIAATERQDTAAFSLMLTTSAARGRTIIVPPERDILVLPTDRNVP